MPRSAAIRSDGGRDFIAVADVHGRFTRARRGVFALLWLVFFAVPLLSIDGRPLLLLDIARREFTVAGFGFSAHDTYLLFFVITGLAFVLFLMTAVVGRVWCGWICPQTVFIDGVIRRIERWIDGPRQQQLQRARAPWRWPKIWRRAAKWGVFALCTSLVSAWLLRYFVPADRWWHLWRGEAPGVFVGWLVVNALFFLNAAWFREQLCVFVCPYGRLQSVLTDDDSLIIGYDERRGEPRGRATLPDRGACVDCRRCVDVCPTGIDIRNGLQLECIGCANCIDACDAIMRKLGRPIGLIRYDSLRGLDGQPRRILRPRLYASGVLLLIGILVAGATMHARQPLMASVLRFPGLPYVLRDETVRNQWYVHVVNKTDAALAVHLDVVAPADHHVIEPTPDTTIEPRGERRLPIFVDVAREHFHAGNRVTIRIQSNEARIEQHADILGP